MAVDMFLKVDGIKGESHDDKHKDEIDVLSFSFGVEQTGYFSGGGGGGAGKASFQDLVITKEEDKSSPILMLKCATGEHIASALLTVRKAGGTQQEYYKVKLSDLLISSFKNAGTNETGGGIRESLIETVSINYSKIEFEYYEQKADGGLGGQVRAGYDIKANKKF